MNILELIKQAQEIERKQWQEELDARERADKPKKDAAIAKLAYDMLAFDADAVSLLENDLRGMWDTATDIKGDYTGIYCVTIEGHEIVIDWLEKTGEWRLWNEYNEFQREAKPSQLRNALLLFAGVLIDRQTALYKEPAPVHPAESQTVDAAETQRRIDILQANLAQALEAIELLQADVKKLQKKHRSINDEISWMQGE